MNGPHYTDEKSEDGAKLAPWFFRSHNLPPRIMRLQKSLLPSAASTTPGVCDWRRIAHIFSLDRTPRGSTHAPTRRSGPCGASPVSLSLARPGLRSPVMVAAASKPVPARPLPAVPQGRWPGLPLLPSAAPLTSPLKMFWS